MQIKFIALIATAAILLSGCLDNDLERAAAGAAAGAVVSQVIDGDLATGALIGAGAGALCDDVNLCN
ncbi:YMGG-like glycine zipper-containing protein [Cochlodiniinecator piscidefendens]|uniref:YMGG-like glycine zipper-containing protein n=1 Tax=Cochlodiniinecator piscidefendens TaxID=2715756 RepID=UPI0014081163|nr:YMGG-like glycine zipper-containing protein [Cochlodiniinecator piscidefendens]